MGKGGRAEVQRGPLSATIPEPTKQITKKSLRESIPPELFKRSYIRSFAHLALDIASVIFSALVTQQLVSLLPAICSPIVWLCYWFYQGINFTALWVLAHECGHGGFTDSKLVNDIVGFVLHSSLLTPYFSWAITHAKHHHYTNHMSEGETWVPSTASADKPAVRFAKTKVGTLRRIAAVALVGWYMYLFNNDTGSRQNRGQSHFSPRSKALFRPKDANYVLASNVGMVAMMGVLAAAAAKVGMYQVFMIYLVPQTISNFYLCAITFMQHTHADVPHFEGSDWTWLRGALSTIDRSMGSWVDSKLHHIVDSHVVHHVFSDMPFYGAKEATPYVKEHLGIFYKSCIGSRYLGSEYLGYWMDFYLNMQESVVVKKDDDGFFWFH